MGFDVVKIFSIVLQSFDALLPPDLDATFQLGSAPYYRHIWCVLEYTADLPIIILYNHVNKTFVINMESVAKCFSYELKVHYN